MEVSREEFFRLCLLQLAAASSFEHLLQLTITKQLQFDAFHVPPLESNQFPCWNIDLYAKQYVPSDAPQNLEPLQTTGNGNCFFNAISLHFCGTERMAIEFRVRCVFTLIDMYNKICSGLMIQTMNNYMQTYLRFSGVFHILQRGQYTQEHIMTYLRTEIKETVKNNSWCGILHFYATATALQRPILSVYPDYNSNIRHNFNILVKPWFQYPDNNVAIPILWSGYINGSNWFTPNHFVPLVTVHVPLALSHNQMTRKRVSSSSGLDSSPKKPYTCLRHLKSTEDRQQNTSQEQQKDNMTLSNVLFKCYDKLPQSHCAHCSQLIMNLSKNTLCPTCISFEKKKQKSPLHTDSIYPGDIPDELLHLNSREVQLISQVHPYMKLLKLPVGGQFAQQGQTINFPVPVQEICSALPRADDHTLLLFPAKTNNNPTVVNINKVNEALTWLKINNSGYIKTHHRTQSTQVQDSTDSNQDSRAEQPVNGNIASPEESILPLPEVSLIPNVYILPKEYENSSLKALRLPILTGQPINIFTDTSAEALAFPHLFPFGKGTYKSIQEHITWHKYFTCRLLNKDRRWSQTIAYLFWALNVYEQHSLQHCVSTAVRVRSPGDTALQAQQVLAGNYSQIAVDFRFMKKMKGTNAYWREQLLDLLAKMRLLGPPTFFISLSSNDNNWLEMYKFLNPQLSDDDLQLLSSSQKNRLLTENPVHAAVYFSMRWKRYLQDYLLGNTHPLGQVLDHFARIEFQNRGSPHIHAFFWIKDSPNIETIEGRQKASAFIDKYISANMPPFDDPLHSLVSRLQVHKHTHTCTKTFSATACRFGFPQPVSTTTTVQLSNLSSTTGRFYTISRDENSTWVNPYNREILSTWQANMDIQMVGCKTAAAVYVCTYVCKNEPASLRSALHKTLQTLPQDATIRQRLSKIGNLLMTHRLISAQETTFRLLNLPMVYSSRATIYMNSNSPEKRHRILKPKALLRSIDPESTDIYTQNMHTIYSRRPLHDLFPTMSLVHFCTNYQLLLKSESIHPSKDHLPRYRLTGTPIEYIRERKHPAAFRTYMKSIHDDKNSHLYSMLCLFLPWRTEDDILTPYDDVATAFRQKHDLMDTPSLVAFNYSEKLEQALQEVRMLNEDIYGDIYCKITPSFCNQEDISDSQHIDNIFTMCEPSIIEATDKAHKQANLSDREIRSLASLTMTDDQFQNTLDMLSQQQKTILDYITNKLDTNPPQHIFITGGAGTGKSFLLKIMREHLLRINQSSLPNVMVAAPTGVAAFNINGWTLHTLLNLDVTHNAYTQYSKLTDKTLHKLRMLFQNVKVLIIDEISMVSAKTLCHIHKRLSEIKDTTNEPDTYFGNISIIAFGDLYQLKPVFGGHIFTDTAEMPVTHLWKKLFQMIELNINFRQQTDAEYVEMLNRIRIGEHSAYDIQHLQEKQQTHIPISTQHIFPITSACKKHNDHCTQVITTNNNHVFQITAIDDPEMPDIPSKANLCGGLHKHLDLCIGSRVMLLRNLQTSTGLVNGAQGVITHIQWRNNIQPQQDGEIPAHIEILFDDPKVGSIYDENQHSSIIIEPITVAFFLPNSRQTIHRTQLPINVSFGVTVHKVQGLTLSSAAVDIGKTVFQGGMAYVALSRVSTYKELHIIDICSSRIYPPPHVTEEMARMPKIVL